MATIALSPAATGTASPIRSVFAALMRVFSAYDAAQSRANQVQRLNGMTDAELARIGLRREDIARYVFRDILYI
ncbi:DUF1127 domain-containing protein [Nioella sp. MMSF_3534]|jgi:uncharacterized protein YjiS (DUF1127 family)|uniref:DUF1127 domain-containing protein n=1 Tax=Nioella sp. MMSF_3534 TaxID=3046720 RepID=UPI00273CFA5E|nr:DUF1127 domain-containing protein [Nioella sp. MMSF_3534]